MASCPRPSPDLHLRRQPHPPHRAALRLHPPDGRHAGGVEVGAAGSGERLELAAGAPRSCRVRADRRGGRRRRGRRFADRAEAGRSVPDRIGPTPAGGGGRRRRDRRGCRRARHRGARGRTRWNALDRTTGSRVRGASRTPPERSGDRLERRAGHFAHGPGAGAGCGPRHDYGDGQTRLGHRPGDPRWQRRRSSRPRQRVGRPSRGDRATTIPRGGRRRSPARLAGIVVGAPGTGRSGPRSVESPHSPGGGESVLASPLRTRSRPHARQFRQAR